MISRSFRCIGFGSLSLFHTFRRVSERKQSRGDSILYKLFGLVWGVLEVFLIFLLVVFRESFRTVQRQASFLIHTFSKKLFMFFFLALSLFINDKFSITWLKKSLLIFDSDTSEQRHQNEFKTITCYCNCINLKPH